MKTPFSISNFAIAVCLIFSPAMAAEISAEELAAKLNKDMQGQAKIRLRLETNAKGADSPVLQLQLKERRTAGSAEIAYEVLWPKERKGETVILRQSSGGPATGTVFEPPDTIKKLGASEMDEGLFGSDLAYQDAVENFFAWSNQELVGTETIEGKEYLILDSKPNSGSSVYSRVRSWIDADRMIPMRIEKFGKSGDLARTITTSRVAQDEGRPIPANLTVTSGKGSVTTLKGARIDQSVRFTEKDFQVGGE